MSERNPDSGQVVSRISVDERYPVYSLITDEDDPDWPELAQAVLTPEMTACIVSVQHLFEVIQTLLRALHESDARARG